MKDLSDTFPQPYGAPCRADGTAPLAMTRVKCCICDVDDASAVAVGEDFEYRTSPDTFLAVQCRGCGLVYLNPRPDISELDRIYPRDYHAYEFSAERFGFVYRVRQRLEAKRLLSACKGLGKDARIIDVGCGDGFHLRLLRDFGQPTWRLEGIEPSDLAVKAGMNEGLEIHSGMVQDLDLPKNSYDLAFMIATIEHVDHPAEVLAAVRSLLKPGGRIVIVTDNTDTLDFRLSKARHWGGYHFPRHWNLFNSTNLRMLAQKVDLEVAQMTTIVSPVNWVYSIRNALVDWNAPKWLINQFSLQSTLSLGVFTIFDMIHQRMGHGALLRAVLRKP
ncbi:class I SAM-dependent methyltransferase [Leptolyngbya boryana CZ1]|uniref:Class I SAM-dependent methyltransferase n=1 Tax=Leptolyngbya boryana CZ1 TaxID=3060204 RepID=A0AA96X6W9_LEPBY|nr:class I SAM-dependent methyltransferase [Leptolyngbya boryana]WNZ46670.1 class I SAM-dependent methyltransferase [Leptolyngbya boryana CZ1]